MSRVYSLAGMLAVLTISYGLDRVWEFLRAQSSRTFNVTPLLWFSGALDLIFAATVLALGWFFLFKSEKSYALSLVFAFAGVLLLVSSPLGALLSRVPFVSLLDPLVRLLSVQPTSYEYHAAAFIAIIGAAGLLRSMRQMVIGAQAELAGRGGTS